MHTLECSSKTHCLMQPSLPPQHHLLAIYFLSYLPAIHTRPLRYHDDLHKTISFAMEHWPYTFPNPVFIFLETTYHGFILNHYGGKPLHSLPLSNLLNTSTFFKRDTTFLLFLSLHSSSACTYTYQI